MLKIGFGVGISRQSRPQIYSMPTDVYIYESRCLKV